MKIKLGSRVKDTITGFKGVVTATCQYLTGCNQCLVSHEKTASDGTIKDAIWFDESRLDTIEEPSGSLLRRFEKADPGGPQQTPSARV